MVELSEEKDIEIILNRLVTSFEFGYEFTKNCRLLLEKLTETKHIKFKVEVKKIE